MNVKEFEKYAGKHTKGKKGKDNLSGGKIIGYDPKDSHPLQLFAVDDIRGDEGRMFEVVIPNKDDLKDYLCGKHKYIWVTVENVIMDELKEITESNKKTVMETRNVKVTLETAQRWYGQGGEFKEIALSAFTESELNPIRNEWESKISGKPIYGYLIDSDDSMVCEFEENFRASFDSKCCFKTEKQAKSALAYAQLTQLMALPEYNGDWVADWNVVCTTKYVIKRSNKSFFADEHSSIYEPISFKSKVIRNKFLENNRDLLKQYFGLD